MLLKYSQIRVHWLLSGLLRAEKRFMSQFSYIVILSYEAVQFISKTVASGNKF